MSLLKLPNFPCPKCYDRTGVIDSRPKFEQRLVWRRRRCVACRFTFTTTEKAVEEKGGKSVRA
ncbi:MAG: hypothetical protein JSS51_03440 [Planctomycetes bacterium]|nr:hypothetical protein [Planctomycetota bacterium]